MRKMLMCIVLLAVGGVVTGHTQFDDDDFFPNGWPSDYDNLYDYDFLKEEEKKLDVENNLSDDNLQAKDLENNNRVEEEIKNFREKNEGTSNEAKEELDSVDYQVEDNRYKSKEEDQKEALSDDDGSVEENIETLKKSTDIKDEGKETHEVEAMSNEDDDLKAVESNVDYALLWGDDDAAPVLPPIADNDESIFHETQELLSEGDSDRNDFEDEKQEVNLQVNEQSNLEQIVDETKKLLADSENNFDSAISSEEDVEEEVKKDDVSEVEEHDKSDEETVDKIQADLDEDIKKLFETFDKLSDDGSEEEREEVADDNDSENVLDYEEKYGKPYREGLVLAQRNDDAIASEEDIHEGEQEDDVSEIKEQKNSNEETVHKIQSNLDEDFKNLFESFDKLSDDGSEEEKEEFADDSNSENVLDYEEKYGKPYREGLVLAQRQNDDYEQIDDSNLSDIFAKADDTASEELDDDSGSVENSVKDQGDTENSEPSPDDAIKPEENQRVTEPIMYQNDALLDGGQKADRADVEEFEINSQNTINSIEAETDESKEKSSTQSEIAIEKSSTQFPTKLELESTPKDIKTKMVDELSSAELDDLMSQFAFLHSEDLDVQSEDFAKHVAPIYLTLSVDEPLIVTSPNYPNPYPTNNIVDWIFEGEGMGIELNMTDFAVNSALGDYLLIKPGGVDESGHNGIIFSYRLRSERRFRFTDVNRMFVRFEAKQGMMFQRGFKFSVRLISPLSKEQESVPDPEPILTPPTETLTLNLGGVNVAQFVNVEEQFRQLVADMAKEYIRDNDVDPGLNTTFEITQITNVALCNIRWPDFETCAEVTFGVPLFYEDETEPRLNEEDLAAMWRTYISKDPFAMRLKSLGITEFGAPNDSSVLTVWLVIAAGVVISMAMLAFALWRFSCFEDYTRMQAFSDTDSMKNEKRGLDLYPTPHQTLPPLYTESEYKWADAKYDDSTRVDMGGFANNSYVRDGMYDFDSDEEVIASRDSYGVISPKDIYSNV